MNRSTRFSLTIPSEAAKKASTCEMKNLEVLKRKGQVGDRWPSIFKWVYFGEAKWSREGQVGVYTLVLISGQVL